MHFKTVPLFSEYSYDCDFENIEPSGGSCRVRQDLTDDFDWTKRIGKTPSGALFNRTINNLNYPVTGPSQAKTGNYYLYSEATGKDNLQQAR